jgi:hypothetical protein
MLRRIEIATAGDWRQKTDIRHEYFPAKNGNKKECRLKISRKISAIVTSRSPRDKEVPRPAFTVAKRASAASATAKPRGRDGDGN